MHPAVEKFLNYLVEEKDYSEHTVAAYRNDLTQLERHLDRASPDVEKWNGVTTKAVAGYVLDLKEREYAAATVARKVAAVKSFFHYLVAQGITRDDPTAPLDSPKVEQRPPKTISRKDVDRLLAEPAKASSPKSLRDIAMIELLYATGMRASETVSLKVDDVNLAAASVRVVGKGANARILPLYPRAVEALEKYLEEGRIHLVKDTDVRGLFLNPWGESLTRQGLWLIIKEYVEEAGLSSDITPHTLRHSFAAHLVWDGADLDEVRRLLGHSSNSTVQMYSELTRDESSESDEAREGEAG